MSVRAGGKVGGVRYAASPTYVPRVAVASLSNLRTVDLEDGTFEVYVSCSEPGYVLMGLATRNEGTPTPTQMLSSYDSTDTECPTLVSFDGEDGETLLGAIDLADLPGEGPVYIYVVGILWAEGLFTSVVGPAVFDPDEGEDPEEETPPTVIRRATGRIGGVRYAGRTSGIVEIVPELTFFTDPIIGGVTSSGFSLFAETVQRVTASMVVTSAAASEPSDAAFDASLFRQHFTHTVDMEYAGDSGGVLKKVWLQLKKGDTRLTVSQLVLLPHEGYNMVAIQNLDDPKRLWASPDDIEVGDLVSWGDIEGTGTVNINEDATFDVDVAVKSFKAYVGNTTTGWRAMETQTITGNLNLAFMGVGF